MEDVQLCVEIVAILSINKWIHINASESPWFRPWTLTSSNQVNPRQLHTHTHIERIFATFAGQLLVLGSNMFDVYLYMLDEILLSDQIKLKPIAWWVWEGS